MAIDENVLRELLIRVRTAIARSKVSADNDDYDCGISIRDAEDLLELAAERDAALANACGEHNTALVSKTMWEKVAVALNETLDAALARVAELEVEVERMRERSAGAER